MNSLLETIELQKILFSKTLNRMSIRSLSPQDISRIVRVHVYRNHAFEPIASVIDPFLAYSGVQVEFSYSDYDDSLSFSSIPADAEIVLVWVDFEHYAKTVDRNIFINERLKFLRSTTHADILFFGLSDTYPIVSNFDLSGCYAVDVGILRKHIGDRLYDERLHKVTATRLSNDACLFIAQWLGLSILPPLLGPNLKAIILDLDNTLYEGVLGEDGVDGIRLTEGHKQLQTTLKSLKDKGFFLGLVSKNEFKDVKDMFGRRVDFPLQWNDFSAVGISWESKSQNITALAEKLRIAPNSMLFIDDNIGEILSVKSNIPTIEAILADQRDPIKTKDTLLLYPGIFKWHRTEDDTKRAVDLRASDDRERLRNSLTREEYMKQLDLHLSFRVNCQNDRVRIAELGGKTNQFILAYKRYKEQSIGHYMDQEDWDVIGFSLRDKLSDSGLIGSVITRYTGTTLFVEDIFISCRALGRDIEDVMILQAIDIVRKKHVPQKIKICYTQGERNRPAISWLQKFSKQELGKTGDVEISSDIFPPKSVYVTVSIE